MSIPREPPRMTTAPKPSPGETLTRDQHHLLFSHVERLAAAADLVIEAQRFLISACEDAINAKMLRDPAPFNRIMQRTEAAAIRMTRDRALFRSQTKALLASPAE